MTREFKWNVKKIAKSRIDMRNVRREKYGKGKVWQREQKQHNHLIFHPRGYSIDMKYLGHAAEMGHIFTPLVNDWPLFKHDFLVNDKLSIFMKFQKQIAENSAKCQNPRAFLIGGKYMGPILSQNLVNGWVNFYFLSSTPYQKTYMPPKKLVQCT